MKIAKVLLRWYKSFNVNYLSYPDRKAGVARRPWNLLARDTDSEEDFPFIEIPLEGDITTIVGANESGKSHLLSAISKVITGHGIPEGDGETSPFSRTDLCHYTSPRSKNAVDWPNVGLQFTDLSAEEMKKIANAIEQPSLAKASLDPSYTLTLVIAPNIGQTAAHIFPDGSEPSHQLNEAQLTALREVLPRVEFIKSGMAISDQVHIGSLLKALGKPSDDHLFDYREAQKVAAEILTIDIKNPEANLPNEVAKKLAGLQGRLQKANLDGDSSSQLEALLFRDVLGISPETLEFIAGLHVSARTHADGQAAQWNREIEEVLNLSHYWQQDDSFALEISYRQGVIYFEITDKTGATYTFKERSSGLRYFLSYYIQAKALEKSTRDDNAIVLMDEPDSFLSILGQRNLLAVFESLVRPESSGQNCQLVYTTHSPFLINRNYPRRLRLVRKGDAEEGTQLIPMAMLRRYEPVRSALGIDCAQTLFMGATNVVVEGPTDQYILGELIRLMAKPDNISELLDLNSVAMMSADGAPSVEKVLSASQWGDESIPATVVLLDSDPAGDNTRARITGNARHCKELIDDAYVLQIGAVLESEQNGQAIITTEDLIPPDIYRDAVLQHVDRWHPEAEGSKRKALEAELKKAEFAAGGLVAGTKAAMNEHVHDTPRDYDKLGVLQEAVAILGDRQQQGDGLPPLLEKRVRILCENIRKAVSASEQVARRLTGKQAITRLIKDFFVTHKNSASVFHVQLLLDRLKKDVDLLGVDGEELDASLKRMSERLEKLRSADQQQLTNDTWKKWQTVLTAIGKNPLSVKITIDEEGPAASRKDDAELAGEYVTTETPDATASKVE